METADLSVEAQAREDANAGKHAGASGLGEEAMDVEANGEEGDSTY